MFGIEPFLHANLALAPTRHKNSNSLSENVRASTGFGLSLKLNSVAVECYYNMFVKGQKNELKSEFQINFGID